MATTARGLPLKTLAALLLAVALLTGGLGAALRARAATPVTVGAPQATGSASPSGWSAIDQLVEQAISAGLTPGAVVLVGQHDRILYERAFGRRTEGPGAEPLTVDTIFDLASLTKVIATTTAVMQLVEAGRLRLSEPVSGLLPGFERHGKAGITVRHLLTHTSGLRPDVDLDPWEGHDAAMARAIDEVPLSEAGTRFVYSDINFFVLGEVVARVSGEPLETYVRRHVFEPLAMPDTGFLPPAASRPRIAPTERCAPMDAWPCRRPDAQPLRGIVHDPTARRMGGVAGHAGLFSTAHDLSRFARMLLHGGTLDGRRVLAPLTVARMTAPSTPVGMPAVRGLGWDIDSPYSANRGELFGAGSFGHTGFTGTSLWVDPASGGYVVFLSSRLYPDGKGDVTALRGKVATAAAAALAIEPRESGPPARRDFGASADPLRPAADREHGPVLSGVDVLARDGFAALKGQRVGLLTNHTGLTATGESTIDVLASAPGVDLVTLFSPEHGIRGDLDQEEIASGTDARSGLPIHSLYGESRRPTAEALAGLDTIVIDLQDVGARFYTYITTVAYVLEAAGRAGVAVMVLDRPNPIGGWRIEGPAAEDAGPEEFIGYLPGMPVRHGLTLGEFARLVNEERHFGAALTVVAMEHWRRDDWFDETGLPWIGPSPNLRTLTQALLYPGVAVIEYANVSVGRGTDRPFEVVGAPWMDGRRLAAMLNARGLGGVRFYPVRFKPQASKYAGEWCGGVSLIVTDRDAFRPVRMGLELAAAIWATHGDQFDPANTARLLGSRSDLARVRAGEDPSAVAARWAEDEATWRRRIAAYLLYR
ncbi:MAG: exo-beta-N-acetylmuramidase NamZ domain-containing protein [Vicinamibacterales bacterium]